MRPSTVDHERLLAEAARLHEKHKAVRPEPFNVFSVLRRPGDEVHLHSRFLAALLDHRQGPGSERLNLADFLSSVVKCEPLDATTTRVQREFSNIDILVKDNTSAVVIENKIWAGDQYKQLERYYEEMRGRGYEDCRIGLFYLTLDGHGPSGDSLGDLKGKKVVTCLSYRQLQPWLKRCGQRAHDEPALRESIAMYGQLVEKLTGDYDGGHMRELKELLLKDKNLLLADELAKASMHAKAHVLCKFWHDLDEQLQPFVGGLQKDPDRSRTSADYFRRYVSEDQNTLWGGSFFKVTPHVHVAVEIGYEVYFGIRCHRDNQALRKQICDALGVSDDRNRWWPWRAYPEPRLTLRGRGADFAPLLETDQHEMCIESIVGGVRATLAKLREASVVDA